MTKASKEKSVLQEPAQMLKSQKGRIDAKEKEWSQCKELVNFQNIFVSPCSLTVKYCKQELLAAENSKNLPILV